MSDLKENLGSIRTRPAYAGILRSRRISQPAPMLVSAHHVTRAIRAGDHVSLFCARATAGPRNTSFAALMRLSFAVIVQLIVTVILRPVFQAPMLLKCVPNCLSREAVQAGNPIREPCGNILVLHTRARTPILHLCQTHGALVTDKLKKPPCVVCAFRRGKHKTDAVWTKCDSDLEDNAKPAPRVGRRGCGRLRRSRGLR
jgi:hypothetical protein